MAARQWTEEQRKAQAEKHAIGCFIYGVNVKSIRVSILPFDARRSF